VKKKEEKPLKRIMIKKIWKEELKALTEPL